jgi:hypothetical protein
MQHAATRALAERGTSLLKTTFQGAAPSQSLPMVIGPAAGGLQDLCGFLRVDDLRAPRGIESR